MTGYRQTQVRAIDRASVAAAQVARDALDLEPLGGDSVFEMLANRPGRDPELICAAFENGQQGLPLGVVIGSVRDGVGFVDLLAVQADSRRQGVGSALLGAVEERLRAAGAVDLKVGGSTWHYAWPGVDLRYTAMLGLLERHGYVEDRLAFNMSVDLRRWASTDVPATLDSVLGPIALRRGAAADRAAADRFAATFSASWQREVTVALSHDPVSVHLALTESGEVVGFGCHGVFRRDWFGPIATDPRLRGAGVGEALLRLCLNDQAALGLESVEIGWIGPRDFYARTVGARMSRVFALHAKTVASQQNSPA